MTCFSECYETPEGGVCEDCPDWFEGDGVNCTDIRVYCKKLGCPESCEDKESGGICIPCPEYHIPAGDGITCVDNRVTCKEKIPVVKIFFLKF